MTTSPTPPNEGLEAAVSRLRLWAGGKASADVWMDLRGRHSPKQHRADLSLILSVLSSQGEALRPFAEAAESLDDEHADGSPIWESPAAMGIDAGHLRNAARTLGDRHVD